MKNLDFQREKILTSARKELSENFELDKKSELKNVIAELGEIKNKNAYEKTADKLSGLIKKALPDDFIFALEQRNEIENISEIYFRLGEKMAPLYIAFADWIYKQIEEKENAVIVFEGRDSLGFFIAYKRRHGDKGVKCLYAPISRATVLSHYINEDKEGQTEKEQERIVDFYKRKELAEKNIYFVDFGFRGTLPRLEQLILKEREQPQPKDVRILLFIKKNSPVMHTEKGQMRDKAFKKLNKTELNKIDEDNLKKVEGFLNSAESIGNSLDIAPGSDEGDDFYMTLQELASYIMEAREDSLASFNDRMPHKTSLAVTSIQALTAKYSFFNGLRMSDLKNQQISIGI